MAEKDTAKALAALPREALVQRVLELQQKNDDLCNEVQQLRRRFSRGRHMDPGRSSMLHRMSEGVSSASFAASVDGRVGSLMVQQRTYSVSLSVLVIKDGVTMVVPLSSIVDKSYMRPDMREADTPAVSMSALRDDSVSSVNFSVENLNAVRSPSYGGEEVVGRGSELRGTSFGAAAAAAAAAAAGPACRPSIMVGGSNSDDMNEPSPRDPATSRGSVVGQQRLTLRNSLRSDIQRLSFGRLINRREGSLGSDALVSNHTLGTFNQQYIDGYAAPSPVSSFGAAVFHYIVRTFALRNGCRHSSADIEMFGRTLCSLSSEVKRVLESEPSHGQSYSPCYVFGDIHGNFLDLFYFLDNLISFQNLRYTPHRFVFLGDYVDRGDFSVEVVAYLFAMKVLAPDKVLLLRGNHEDTLVSGDIGGYGSTSFRAQCRDLFGYALGEELWNHVSDAFAHLPLTANIDGKIFCTHGGIPRYSGGVDNRLQLLSRDDFPAMRTFFQAPERETPEHEQLRMMAMDTCWADPAEDESQLDKWGFGASPRGRGVILFGSKAVDDFLAHYNFEYIFRAHQEKSDGLKLSKNARVFTIFSTSAYVGHENGAGVVLVANGKIRLIIKNADSEELINGMGSGGDVGDNEEDMLNH